MDKNKMREEYHKECGRRPDGTPLPKFPDWEIAWEASSSNKDSQHSAEIATLKERVKAITVELEKYKNAEIVAWLHESDKRYDCIHDKVKTAFLQFDPHKVEHYTICLIIKPEY